MSFKDAFMVLHFHSDLTEELRNPPFVWKEQQNYDNFRFCLNYYSSNTIMPPCISPLCAHCRFCTAILDWND